MLLNHRLDKKFSTDVIDKYIQYYFFLSPYLILRKIIRGILKIMIHCCIIKNDSISRKGFPRKEV